MSDMPLDQENIMPWEEISPAGVGNEEPALGLPTDHDDVAFPLGSSIDVPKGLDVDCSGVQVIDAACCAIPQGEGDTVVELNAKGSCLDLAKPRVIDEKSPPPFELMPPIWDTVPQTGLSADPRNIIFEPADDQSSSSSTDTWYSCNTTASSVTGDKKKTPKTWGRAKSAKGDEDFDLDAICRDHFIPRDNPPRKCSLEWILRLCCCKKKAEIEVDVIPSYVY